MENEECVICNENPCTCDAGILHDGDEDMDFTMENEMDDEMEEELNNDFEFSN